MIDKETAIAWAKFSDAHVAQLVIDGSGTLGEPVIIFNVSQLQSLITSIQNKAFEQAAIKRDRISKAGPNCDGYGLADEIRALKRERSA